MSTILRRENATTKKESAFSTKVGAILRRENATKKKNQHFPAKWKPPAPAKMRQNKGLEHIRDSMKRDYAPEGRETSPNRPPAPEDTLAGLSPSPPIFWSVIGSSPAVCAFWLRARG